MDPWTIAWVVWILGFFAVEIPAILNDRKDDTLSEHLRNWFAVRSYKGRTAWIVVSGAFFAWFVVHIAAPGWQMLP